jgi:uncharacterized protein YjbJ (UPF0337 family)
MKITPMKLIGLPVILTLLVCSFRAYAEETKEVHPLNINKDQIKGRVNEAQGKAKEETGKLLNNKGMEVEGNVQKNVGKVQKGYGDTKKEIQEGK